MAIQPLEIDGDWSSEGFRHKLFYWFLNDSSESSTARVVSRALLSEQDGVEFFLPSSLWEAAGKMTSLIIDKLHHTISQNHGPLSFQYYIDEYEGLEFFNFFFLDYFGGKSGSEVIPYTSYTRSAIESNLETLAERIEVIEHKSLPLYRAALRSGSDQIKSG